MSYYFKSNITSQDPDYPLTNLLNKSNNQGWLSDKFCNYPQEIIVEFQTYVNIRQINILLNETKIPTIIEFINCIYPPENEEVKTNTEFKSIGYVKLSSNKNTNYKARELRKIYINIVTKQIKLIVHKNYSNIKNLYYQVGIEALDFYGHYVENDKIKKNNNNNNSKGKKMEMSIDENIGEIDDNFLYDKLDKSSLEKLNKLKEEIKTKKENEEYDECIKIKNEIDKFKKIALKIYNLENYKKELSQKDDFDNAKKIKLHIDILKKTLNNYINGNGNINEIDTTNNGNLSLINEEGKMNKDNSIYYNSELYMQNYRNKNLSKKLKSSKSQPDFVNYNEQNYDETILPTLQKKLNYNVNSSGSINNNSFENNNSFMNTSGHCDSFNGMNENDPIEKEPLEELNPEIQTKFQSLINIFGEDVLQKIFSKYIYYKEEGFDLLNLKSKDIIIDNKISTSDANKYIISLINIFFNFLDDKHPSIVCKCLELFLNILKGIEERSQQNQKEYDFKITKKILDKIKEKLNHISKRVRLKASELYCYMLEKDFCEYSTLIVELVEKDVNLYFNKLGILYNNQVNMSKNLIITPNFKPEASKQLIITKMSILLEILKKIETNQKNSDNLIKKFPQNIVGDYIAININHPKEEVRDITKEVLIQFIRYFGNKIFTKLKYFVETKELMKLFQDKHELKMQMSLVEEEENNKKSPKNNLTIIQNRLFLKGLNLNKKLSGIKKEKKLLSPIDMSYNNIKAYYLRGMKFDEIIKKGKSNDKSHIIKSSSQPKYNMNKIKLKPIMKSNRLVANKATSIKSKIIYRDKINVNKEYIKS